MKINALTGTRAIAAIMVVLLHYGSNLPFFNLAPKLFASGNLSVNYFFVLSGFVLFISQKKVPFLSFISRRFARLAPAYMAALALTAVFFYHFYPDPAFPVQLISSALFVQSFFPRYVLELNGPAWSVSVEMFFYLIFPLLLVLAGKRRAFCLVAISAWLVTQCIHLRYCNEIGALTGSGIYFNPLIHVNEFMLGMVGGILYQRRQHYFQYRWLSFTLTSMLVLLILIRPDNVSYTAGLISPVFMLLIVSIAINDVRWLDGAVPVFLGEISYGIYIYQLPVFKWLQKANKSHFHLPEVPLFFICLATLLITAVLSYFLIEQPFLRRVKKRTTTRVSLAKNDGKNLFK